MDYRPLYDRLAAEYVLGTLHGQARSRFLQLLRGDPALQARVDFWENALVPMASPLQADAPSGEVWRAIAARVAPAAPQPKTGWLERWLGVRMVGALAMGMFIGVTAALIGPGLLNPAQLDDAQLPESYVGVLAAADGRTGLIVSSRRHGRVMDVKQVRPLPIEPGRTRFLWAIDGDGKTRPIGPVPPGSFVQVPLAQSSEQLFSSAVELAVSVESIGTAPVVPAAAFVYRGLCGKLWRVPTPQK